MADALLYVYGIVPASLDASGAPAGVDEAPVGVERTGDVGALTSAVDANAYRESEIESRMADMEWLGPRARAHDRVVTWASDAGGVIPLPVFSLFRDASRVRAMLDERGTHLAETLRRVAPAAEYIVRAFRLDAPLTAVLGAVSETVAGLERQIAAASPGQRYLLGRKLEQERTKEVRRIGQQVASDAYAALASAAMEATRNPLPRGSGPVEGGAGAAVLDAAFLVRRDGIADFQRVLTELVRQWEPRGFRFEFTGPWPPYHFVRIGPDDE